MTNFAHYQLTVSQVNRVMLQEIATPWQVRYDPTSTTSGMQALMLVSPRGTICQRLTLPAEYAQQHWPDQASVSAIVVDYLVRGVSRVAPLRQSAFRNNFSQWLESGLQQLQAISTSIDYLLEMMRNTEYPFPSQVNIEGRYLPCWAWGEEGDETLVSVIDRRTGQFGQIRKVNAEQMIDREKWLGAQVIDSVEESLETVHYYVDELIESQRQPVRLDEPSLGDVLRNPCAANLSSTFSVALTLAVVAGFFIAFKWLLGF